ncbi:LacI family DNA-binding transcriptional regulator [Allosaccharopolyspora coralli]|uniref:LacI family DNA-binding transcriptional regulator n=1 Tax=Allosaccharopolyspora coralli TaxID=2665642 RepID=A0A5Q3Q6V7_9PSEU|nr:LacI family DNA-binding transcriptional regulator [Allosaccharopolyspora coralli]QGK70063.1 LacI family DNA-binding transcriptional regulator [Allosaccharopolyspora coralli]
MSVSVEDVAQRAGVSVSTVSRALRGLSGVSESTRDRVRLIAAELGYTVSPSASRLASGRTRTVGVVAPLVNRWFFSQVIAGAAAVLREAGYDLLLCDLGDAEGRKRFFERPSLRGRVDAVIALCLPLAEHEVRALKELDVPVAMVGVQAPGFGSVCIDDVTSGAMAMRHLLNLGHERVGLLRIGHHGGANDHFPDDRSRGYRQALAERGLEVDEHLEAHDRFGVDGGARAMGWLLSGRELPTAVAVECDEMAFGALRTLRSAGLRVPEDVSVIGFDDQDMAEVFGLTTVRQPVPEQGNQAALLVLDALETADGRSPSQVTMPTELVIRASTAPPRGTRTGVREQEPGASSGSLSTTSVVSDPHRRPPVAP